MKRIPKNAFSDWPPRLVGLFWLVASLFVATNGPVEAQTPALPKSASGKQIALLIGVEKYQKVQQLKFVRNDVKRLAEVLRERGGFNEVVELSDGAEDENRWPRKETVMTAVSKWLKGRAKNDTVVVYFSGHGFRDANGAMYLAPLDISNSRNGNCSGIVFSLPSPSRTEHGSLGNGGIMHLLFSL